MCIDFRRQAPNESTNMKAAKNLITDLGFDVSETCFVVEFRSIAMAIFMATATATG